MVGLAMSPIVPPCSCCHYWTNRSSLVPVFRLFQYKLVAQIVAGKYIDLSDLLSVNLVQREPEPQLLFDDRLVLTSQPKQQRRHIQDIASWMEAFAIFSLILVSHFPNRWKDLMQFPDHPDNLPPFFLQSLASI